MIFVNGDLVVNDRFPNGELLINRTRLQNSIGSITYIRFYYRTDADLLEFYMVSKYVKEWCDHVRLRIEYMPYSRMDRKEFDNDPFTLKYVCDLINSLGFEKIEIFEPHSNVCTALLNATKIDFLPIAVRYLRDHGMLTDKDYLFFPDASAQKRYSDILHNPYLLGFKHRDWNTGKITSYQVMNPNQSLDFQGCDVSLNTNVKVFIIDDLCAKGTTAWNAGNELQKLGFEDIYLVVAHCEDTVFEGKLLREGSPIKTIYTTDSILTTYDKRLVRINVD